MLHDDPSLGKLNLGVEVENGVATVWGAGSTLPSPKSPPAS
ncbi:MAG: hypothetical protein U0797_22540 [Gemmataceae bacterium]